MSCPIVLLSLVMTVGIDLPTVALSTACVALWVRDRRILAGIALGLAAAWKYPALVLLPVLIGHGRRRSLATLGAFAVVFGAVEIYLLVHYGRLHLLEVLLTADEIGRGPLLSRATGILFRLGTFFGGLSPWALLGVVPALVVEQDQGLGGVLLLALLAGCGIATLVRAARTGGLFGWWALAAVAGVLVHNYADGRYLLPAVLPLAVVCGALPRRWLLLAAAGQLVLAGLMVHAELAYAREAAALDLEADRFTGEWSFRHAMRERGGSFWSPEESLPPGTRVAVPTHASPGPVPENWIELESQRSSGGAALRLVDLERGVGWHADTLGTMPFWFAGGPYEEVRVLEVR